LQISLAKEIDLLEAQQKSRWDKFSDALNEGMTCKVRIKECNVLFSMCQSSSKRLTKRHWYVKSSWDHIASDMRNLKFALHVTRS
jgi:hypothetical protein